MHLASCLKYFGGKYRGIDQLLRFFPSNWANRCYVEPFAGSLSVFFNVAPKTAVLNDADHELVNFWIVVSDIKGDYDIFSQRLSRSIYSLEFINEIQKEIDLCKEKEIDECAGCRILRALIYYLKNRMSFSGFEGVSENIPNRNILHETLDQWHSFFSNSDVRIWHKDFREVFDRLETSSDKWTPKFIYCDPPYVEAGSAYHHAFVEQDHRDLAEKLTKSKYDWVLSYDDHPMIRELYKDFTIVKAHWFYSAAGGKGTQKDELIITNTVDSVHEI